MLRAVGEAASWLWLVLLCIIVFNVLARYLFGAGRVELEELQWHVYSLGFLLGLSYAFASDNHIRVDVLHERFRPRVQAWLELYGIVLLLLPFIALVLFYAVPFTWRAWQIGEVSGAPGGLPMRWLIKAVLPLAFGLLLLAALSRLSRVWAFLFRPLS
jgi:TRAP-type mannitol/chloroaromatic compound transport system permease small subunit